MFMYPNGVFDGNPLAEFVVFEIPTFLLFSLVIVAIYFWKTVIRKGFFEDNFNKHILIFGLIFVWSLWIIVTVVYAEVVLGKTWFFSFIFNLAKRSRRLARP